MEIETKKINIFKKGLIPFKLKISYTYFKGKLYIYPDNYIQFKKSFQMGFSQLIFNDNDKFNLFSKYDSIKGFVITELNRDFYKFKIYSFRKRKPLSKEAYKKQVEGTRKYQRDKRENIQNAKEELKTLIKWY